MDKTTCLGTDGWYSLPVAETHAASKEAMKFDGSMPDSFVISAGDPVGHMGYYQHLRMADMKRDTVHIECTSMDDNLETFLTNPEQVGEKNPLWLKYAPGLALYKRCCNRNIHKGYKGNNGRGSFH